MWKVNERTDDGFLYLSDSYFLFAVLVVFYTHWTYMHIFLSNYWWQKSDIWSHTSYRYPISWEAFLNPSDSYFLFADLVEVGIWQVQKRYPQYGIPIWRLWPNIRFLLSTVTDKSATKNILDGRMDRRKTVYLPPPSGSGDITCDPVKIQFICTQASYRYTILWVAFLYLSDSYFLFAVLVVFYTHWTYMHIFLSNYWWQKSDIWSQFFYF
jgi:hypothetical protein